MAIAEFVDRILQRFFVEERERGREGRGEGRKHGIIPRDFRSEYSLGPFFSAGDFRHGEES